MKVAELGKIGEFGKGWLKFKWDNQRCTLGSGDFDRKMANFANKYLLTAWREFKLDGKRGLLENGDFDENGKNRELG